MSCARRALWNTRDKKLWIINLLYFRHWEYNRGRKKGKNQKRSLQTRKDGEYKKMNMNKDALVSAISVKTDLSKRDVEAVLEGITEVVTSQLREGSKVTLTGFGTFRVSNRAAREGINPQTKAKIHIPAMRVPKFTAGKSLKESVKQA